jgi:hypothetical protein
LAVHFRVHTQRNGYVTRRGAPSLTKRFLENREAAMTPIEDGTLVKLFGDISEEPFDAAYRVAAQNLRKAMFGLLVRSTNNVAQTQNFAAPQAVEGFLADPKTQFFGEVVAGFVLSVLLEFSPGMVPLEHMRRKLAYNLRVQLWQDVEDGALQKGGNEFIQLVRGSQAEVINFVRGGRAEIDSQLAELRGQLEQLSAKMGSQTPSGKPPRSSHDR